MDECVEVVCKNQGVLTEQPCSSLQPIDFVGMEQPQFRHLAIPSGAAVQLGTRCRGNACSLPAVLLLRFTVYRMLNRIRQRDAFGMGIIVQLDFRYVAILTCDRKRRRFRGRSKSSGVH